MSTPSPKPDDWKIARRGGGCAGCGAAFEPGREAVSAIYAGSPSFERRDWCGPCFQDASRRGDPFSWWSSVVPEPEKKKAVFDLGVAKEFLLRLLAEADPARDSLRYLLTLLLLRKKIVVLVGQEPDGTGAEVMTLRVPPDEETVHQVRCVDLDQAETDRLRDELGRLFQI